MVYEAGEFAARELSSDAMAEQLDRWSEVFTWMEVATSPGRAAATKKHAQ